MISPHQNKPTIPQVRIYRKSTTELISPSVDRLCPPSLSSTHSLTRHRRIPNHLVLPPSKFFTFQRTPSTGSDLSGKRMTIMSPSQTKSDQGQDANQRQPAQHVKMGNRYSCPRTPLRSVGSSSGLTPTLERWRRKRADSDSSFHSPSILTHLGSDLAQSADELTSTLYGSLPRSPNSDQNGQSGSLSPPTTPSPGSCSSDAGSIYSYDSYAKGNDPLEASTTPVGDALAPRPIITSPSDASDFSQAALPSRNHYPEFAPASPKSTITSPMSLLTSPKSMVASPKPLSAIRSRRSRASLASLTPSLVTEPTKTIQARRSFGQLLLFRRPSQLRVGASVCVESCHLHQPDEETEELQNCMDTDIPPVSTSHLGDLDKPPHALKRGSNSIDHGDIRTQHGEDTRRPSYEELHPSQVTEMDRDGSNRSILPQSRDVISLQHRADQSTERRGSRGLLRIVKSQSSLRETFFGLKRSERSQSVQFDQLAANSVSRIPEGPGSSPTLDYPRRNSEARKDSFSTYHIGQPIESSSKNEEGIVDSKLKRGSFSQSPGLKVFQFWKKKNRESAKPTWNIGELLKSNDAKKDMKKSHAKKTGERSSLRIEQISSPIPITKDTRIQSLSLHNRSLLSSNFNTGDSEKLSSEKEISLSCLKEQDRLINLLHSPASGNSSSPTIVCPSEPNMIENILFANSHLPKPSRPPRRRPVMMTTVS